MNGWGGRRPNQTGRRKGTVNLGLYASLVEAGIMDEARKENFEDDNSDLLGHPFIVRRLLISACIVVATAGCFW